MDRHGHFGINHIPSVSATRSCTALLDALAKSLLADEYVSSARILASNTTNGILGTSVWWSKQPGSLDGPRRIDEVGLQVGEKPSVSYPW